MGEAGGEIARGVRRIVREYEELPPRRFQPRNLGDEKPFSSLRRTVEHEALVSLTAAVVLMGADGQGCAMGSDDGSARVTVALAAAPESSDETSPL